LLALGIGPGDQVIVPTLTFISTAYTVLLAGAVPVLADVCRDTITIDPQDIAQKLSPRTKAVVPVHWFGHPADMEAITALATAHDLWIVEDCAHGPGIALHGRETGSFGQIACWSLQESKILTAAGEGGVATTDDEVLAGRLRQVRDHGKAQESAISRESPTERLSSYRVTALGNNYRLSEMQAAFARAQLAKLPEMRERRRTAYLYLREGLDEVAGLEFQSLRPGAELSFAYFPVLFPQEAFSAPVDQIDRAMHAEGVMTHPIARDELCHVHPLFAEPAGRATAPAYRMQADAPFSSYGWGALPVAERIAGELLLLPLHPGLSQADLADIVEATRKVATHYRR
jgi:dTDP-4-amino-4,6-dideoxygalactose transaminase